MLSDAHIHIIERKLGSRVRSCTPLHGGCVASVFRVVLADGQRLAVKAGASPDAGLDTEARMLRCLTETGMVPVPGVRFAEPDLLVIDHVENDGTKSSRGEAELADLLSALHGSETGTGEFGFGFDTRIGGLVQVNTPGPSWAVFYAEHRLLDMGRRAEARGALSRDTMDRLGVLAGRIEVELAGSASRPSLIHGDLWAGNVLWKGGSPVALIDPACSHADPEVELSFIDLMGGMGPSFWDRYGQHRPIAPGFWDRRRLVYQLYPLLVHAVLFGGGYAGSVSVLLGRLGY